MKNKSPLEHYLAACECQWYDVAKGRPLRTERRGKTHALRNPGHRVTVTNLTQLRVLRVIEYGLGSILDNPTEASARAKNGAGSDEEPPF